MRLLLAMVIPVLFAATSCHPVGAKSSHVLDDSTPLSSMKVDITLVHQAGHPEWRISYKFDQAIDGLIFRPYTKAYRADNWRQVEGPQIAWRTDANDANGDVEVAATASDERFDQIAFTFDRLTTVGELMLFQPFSDGSVAIHWGNLTPYLLADAKLPTPSMERFAPNFHIVPLPSEKLVAEGQVAAGTAVDFIGSPRSYGSYLYFGNLPITIENGLPVVADPEIPALTSAMVKDALKRSFALFTDKFGKLPFTPSVLLVHDHADGYNSASGFAQWGQFVVHLRGQTEPDPAERESILNAAVHETSHFWNAIAYQGNDTVPLETTVAQSTYIGWLYEGGAQALANDAMRQLGIISPERYLDRRSGLLSECQKALGTKQVIDRPTLVTGTISWAPYACGELVQYLVTDLASAQNPGYDALQLWRDLLDASPKQQYDNSTFIGVVQSAVPGISADKIDALRQFITTSGPEISTLVDRLKAP